MSDRLRGIHLEGRRVLVTGAGSGIGRGIAGVLASLGAELAINDISQEAADQAVAELTEQGATAVAVTGDITQAEDAEAVVATAATRLGGLDGLVNNAGIPGVRDYDQITRDAWDRVISLNLSAPFHLSVAAVPYLRESAGGGRIVNIASIAATRISVLGGAAYTASKAGLVGITRHLAMELARDGITVNAVLPGVTLTPLVRAHTNAETLAGIENGVPVGRAGDAQDPAWATAFLLSEQASYISGADLVVDGAITVMPGNYTSYQEARGGA